MKKIKMSRSKIIRISLFAVLCLFIFTVVFLVGFYSSHGYAKFDQQSFPLFDQAYKILQNHALNPLPSEKAMDYGLIRGMLQVYDDPYTSFIEPPQHELQTNRLAGRFGGIGVRIQRDTNRLYRLYPLPESPAAQVGILDGDLLLQVNDLQVTDETLEDEVQAAIRGPVDEPVLIIISRGPEGLRLEFSPRREEISLPSVVWNLLPEDSRIGILRVNVIAATTSDELRDGFKELRSKGAEVFILDLRNNAGGLVDAGINIARLFLPQGTPILEQQYRNRSAQLFSTEEDGAFLDDPLFVFINQGTASSAEIVAGALKSQKRATIIGAPSFGKDTIQLVFDLNDGSSLHVTAARWWVPGLEPPIHVNGVQPDILIDPEAADDLESLYFERVMEILNP
jgi:carboxyl-terminal processing protease